MKGKEAAAAARRRIEVLEVELRAANEKHLEQSRQAAEVANQLREEVTRAQGLLSREVENVAAARIAEVTDRLTEEHKRREQLQHDRVIRACRWLAHSENFSMRIHSLGEFCGILGITFEDFAGTEDVETNRYSRRMTAGKMNRNRQDWEGRGTYLS